MRQEFNRQTKEAAHERSGGKCECGCGVVIAPRRPEYHHAIEAGLGGSNDLSNCMVLHPICHRRITSQRSIPVIAKVKRIHAKRIGTWPKSSRPIRSRGFQKREIEAEEMDT